MELLHIISPILSGIITGVILLIVSQTIAENQKNSRRQSLIAFLRLEIINNHRLLDEFEPGGKQPPVLEDGVWEKVSTDIIGKLPFALTNHLIVHYYFIRNSAGVLPAISPGELERQKNRMKFLVKRLQNYSK